MITYNSEVDNYTSSSTTNVTFLPCQNPEDLVTDKAATIVEKVFHVGVFPLLELFGVTTNIINCLVFVRQGLQDRINLCLFSLAMADTCFLLSIFVAMFHTILGLVDKDLGDYWSQKYLNTVLGFLLGFLNISNAMTLIIAVERCICVMAPFVAKRFLKTKYMAILILLVVLYVLGLYTLVNMKYVTVLVTNPVTNTTSWVSRLSSFYTENKTVIDILYNYLLGLAVPCISLVTVVLATSLTVSRLRVTLAWRKERANVGTQQMTSRERREVSVTKMLTVVCCVYVSTITPSVTQAFARTLIPGYLPTGKLCNTFRVVQTFAHTFEIVNSSSNFLIYVSMATRFRNSVMDMCGRRQKNVSIIPVGVYSVSHESGAVSSKQERYKQVTYM